jgi:hypothetical protein
VDTNKVAVYSLSPGDDVRIGVPAKPDRVLGQSIATILLKFPEICEAHLPLCYVQKTIPKPSPVLVLILEKSPDQKQVVNRIRDSVARILPPGKHLNVWPLAWDNSLTESVRMVDCRILVKSPSGITLVEDPFSPWRMFLRRLRRKL